MLQLLKVISLALCVCEGGEWLVGTCFYMCYRNLLLKTTLAVTHPRTSNTGRFVHSSVYAVDDHATQSHFIIFKTYASYFIYFTIF